jgi:hypothetical protein
MPADNIDLEPFQRPLGKTDVYPQKDGYVATATSETEADTFSHRASTMRRDPLLDASPTPVYEEYSSAYRVSRPPSTAPRVASGHSKTHSEGRDSSFAYRSLGSPPPVQEERRQSSLT